MSRSPQPIRGKKPFETVDLTYGKQVLWPDHCVQGTDGAALSKDLSIPQAGLVIRKGFHKDVDSYSAFTEADGKTTTGLAAYLKARKVKRLFVAGLATDFCVAWTALDARKAGFETYVVEDACRGIDTQGSLAKAWADMAKAGVKRIQSGDIAANFARRRFRPAAGLGAALGDADQRRAQHALADHVAGLHDLHHGARGTDGSGTSYIACWKFGSNFSPAGSNFLTPFFSSALSSERSVSSTPSISAFRPGSAAALASAGTASSARCRLSAISSTSRAKPVMP